MSNKFAYVVVYGTVTQVEVAKKTPRGVRSVTGTLFQDSYRYASSHRDSQLYCHQRVLFDINEAESLAKSQREAQITRLEDQINRINSQCLVRTEAGMPL